tara:strand:- start:434 stop:1150 length:717 start_codon:yes stop_codon:yes gene_type:complete
LKIIVFLIFLFVYFDSELSYASPALKTHSAEYEVKISFISGALNTELKKDGENFIARHIIEPTELSRAFSRGMLDVTSKFQIVSGKVRPVYFKAIDTIRNKPNINLNFNWEDFIVNGSIGKELVKLEFKDIIHDNVSIQYELMNDLLSGTIKKQYKLFDIDKLKILNITQIEERQIKTIAGDFKTIGIQHQKEGSSQITTLWCAKELDYLPVLIEQHRKGKLRFRASLSKYTPNSEKY